MISKYQDPEIIITVVTYNSDEDIARCVHSLAAHFQPLSEGSAEVHVVDNASTDDTPRILRRLAEDYDWLKLHDAEINLGFGGGNNLVLNNIRARAHVLLNADAWLVADSLTPALKYLSSHPEVGIIGLPLVYPNGLPQTNTFMFSSWHRWLIVLIGLRVIAKWLIDFSFMRACLKVSPLGKNFIANHDKPRLDLEDSAAVAARASNEVRSVDWVAGAAMVLSQNFLNASGGFDPEIFLYGEDEDLCIQAHQLGFAVESCATAPVVHKLGWGSSGEFRPVVARMKYESLKYFIAKNINGVANRSLMMMILPFYVYGRNVAKFLWRAN